MRRALDRPVSVRELLSSLGERTLGTRGSLAGTLTHVVSLDERDAADALTFCSAPVAQAVEPLARSAARVVLCRPEVMSTMGEKMARTTLIGVANPRLCFIDVARRFLPATTMPRAERSRGHIAKTARLDAGVFVGPGAVVGENCRIGEGTRIDATTVIYDGTEIGRNCLIQAGAVIGAEGFGFERDERGRLQRFPQLGTAVIEDNVEVGARVCIDRGALTETRIGEGTKIDDSAYIAHNVSVGKHCLIMAGSVLCGSCSIGDRVEISPGAIIRDYVSVGNDARVGLGAVVVKDVRQGDKVKGLPARSYDSG